MMVNEQKYRVEYVRSSDLLSEIESWRRQTGNSYQQLARRAQVSPRLLRFIISNQRQYQNIFTADRLMQAMNKNIYHLPLHQR